MSREIDPRLVACAACGALRAARFEECFCRETATRPVYALPSPEEERRAARAAAAGTAAGG